MAPSLFDSRPELRTALAAACVAAVLAGCGSAPPRTTSQPPPSVIAPPERAWFSLPHPDHAQEVVLYALGLLDTGYRFGGRNPEAGLDCSGMVSFIVEQVSGQRLPHNAAQIAERTRPVASGALQPGDLVFFNTLGRAYSHMGIYLGDGRFIHAPNSRGKVRVDRLDNRYFAERFEGGRTLLPRG
ncbi:MAG TPA: C40 family peptidase [Zoogloea sp.]|uniref:C40 family peptidase n=1 Tax=Zoogloea sp. TaxID=49181 RepID=UPI002CE3E925|nr:C40 family peptidase [Zoogloea sp.]HMV16962.1 C40 family peptidase [Rhodocyclaceae bacterium]HMV62132.1 C40 family peptidase [Rhodocyclaceae bacterium]HMW53262.1 C40 family peptidase [Rhodocyclaceae bacterium]HMY49050.1 C40 family peptidase [Rhodocyclaceae bacterium]HNA67373.1 C40 family peptidase [Rhodocyclaceae bacterium]